MRFLKKLLNATHTITPRVINTDKNAAYIPAIEAAKDSGHLPEQSEHGDAKYINNRVEWDHRRIKKLIRYCIGFGNFGSAQKTISGYEAMHIVRKGTDWYHARNVSRPGEDD